MSVAYLVEGHRYLNSLCHSGAHWGLITLVRFLGFSFKMHEKAVNAEGLIERCFHSKCMKRCMMGYGVLYRRASCISKLVYYFVVIRSLVS